MNYRQDFYANLKIHFNKNLTNDESTVYRVFESKLYGTPDAKLLCSGDVKGRSSVDEVIETQGQPIDVTVVALGLHTAQFVIATGTIDYAVDTEITLAAALERSYSNPPPTQYWPKQRI